MREFISIVEARPQKAPVVDHAAQAQALYDKTVRVAKEIGRYVLNLQKWNHQWVDELRRLTTQARQAHAASEQENVEYEPTYQPRPFQMNDYIDQITATWWDSIEPTLDQMTDDAKYGYEEYQDAHPKVEQSDTMTVHQGEVQMAKTIRWQGSDTPQGMDIILNAISSFADTLGRSYDYQSMHPCAGSTLDVITSIIPAIMAICQMRGAKRSG